MIHRTRKLLQRVSLPWGGRDRGPTPFDHVQEHPDFPPTTPLPHTPQDASIFALQWLDTTQPSAGTLALAALVLHVATVICNDLITSERLLDYIIGFSLN